VLAEISDFAHCDGAQFISEGRRCLIPRLLGHDAIIKRELTVLTSSAFHGCVVVNRKAACCDQCVIQARRRVECSGGKPVEPFIESTDPRHVERLTGFAQAYIKEQSRSALLLLRELFAKAFDLLV
jgi:hypothetical protein